MCTQLVMNERNQCGIKRSHAPRGKLPTTQIFTRALRQRRFASSNQRSLARFGEVLKYIMIDKSGRSETSIEVMRRSVKRESRQVATVGDSVGFPLSTRASAERLNCTQRHAACVAPNAVSVSSERRSFELPFSFALVVLTLYPPNCSRRILQFVHIASFTNCVAHVPRRDSRINLRESSRIANES